MALYASIARLFCSPNNLLRNAGRHGNPNSNLFSKIHMRAQSTGWYCVLTLCTYTETWCWGNAIGGDSRGASAQSGLHPISPYTPHTSPSVTGIRDRRAHSWEITPFPFISPSSRPSILSVLPPPSRPSRPPAPRFCIPAFRRFSSGRSATGLTIHAIAARASFVNVYRSGTRGCLDKKRERLGTSRHSKSVFVSRRC